MLIWLLSWSSKGWSARDGVVAAISADTGKVLDVRFKTNSCPQCTEMENKRKGDEVTRMEFLEWYLKHEPNCYINHEGSSQVFFQFLFIDSSTAVELDLDLVYEYS